MRDLLKKQILQSLKYSQDVEADKGKWQTTFHNLNIRNAQSDNPETNRKYRHGQPGNSALVKDIHYNDKNNTLKVKYRNGYTAIYDNMTAADAAEFAKADSKGRWALKNLWNLKYRKG